MASSTTRVLGAACGGGVLGAAVFGLLTWPIYNFFFPGGFHRLGDQAIPIYVIFTGIGGLIGLAAGAAWALPESPLRSGRSG